jgi:uncharacterized membrane protein
MAEKLAEALRSITDNYYVIVLIISMIPLIELKGAIPIGTKLGLGLWQTALTAYVGSTVVCLAVFFLLIPVFKLLKKIPFLKKLVLKIEGMFERKAAKIAQKADGNAEKQARKMKMLSLFIFVAVPFPVTGVWTGTAIAVFLNMKFGDSLLPLALGNFVSGSIITLLTFLFADYVDIIIYVLFAIAIVMLVIVIVKIALSKPKQVEEVQEQLPPKQPPEA